MKKKKNKTRKQNNNKKATTPNQANKTPQTPKISTQIC